MMVVMIIKMLKNRKLLDSIFYLILIPIAGFIQLLHTQIIVYIFPEKGNVLTDLIVVIYMITEYMCLVYFLLSKLNISGNKSLLISIFIPATIVIGYAVDGKFIDNWSFTYIMLETITLIIGSLFLMSKLTLDDSINDMMRNSDFLIGSAIFFTFSYFAPFYAIRKILLENIDVYVRIQTLVIVFGYSIFYTLLTLAIIWKTKPSRY